jgi:hypothetical protein
LQVRSYEVPTLALSGPNFYDRLDIRSPKSEEALGENSALTEFATCALTLALIVGMRSIEYVVCLPTLVSFIYLILRIGRSREYIDLHGRANSDEIFSLRILA